MEGCFFLNGPSIKLSSRSIVFGSAVEQTTFGSGLGVDFLENGGISWDGLTEVDFLENGVVFYSKWSQY